MTYLIYILFPLILLMLLGGLLGLWVMILYRRDRHLEEIATKIGFGISIFIVLWIVSIISIQKQAPVLNPGQVAIFLGGIIWLGQSYVQQRVRQRIFVMLPLVVVLIMFLGGISSGLRPVEVPETLLGLGPALHISLSLAGIAMLLGSGVYGAGQVALHRQIKQRSFGILFSRMPSLGDMNKLRRITLFSGWMLVTLSLISAVIWMNFIAERSESGPVISHLHPMLTMWVVISILASLDRFRWLSQQRLAFTSVIFATIVFILLVISVIEIFMGKA